MQEDTLHSIVKKAEQDYISGTTKIGEHVDWSMHDTIERIFAYLNSKHTSGDKDSLGRDKPFFNIVSAAVNIWYRATDLDRKDIVVLPNSSKTIIAAFLATILLQDWMKRSKFGTFLNSWGRVLAQYGSAVVKFTEKNGELIPTVVPWNRLVVDQVDFTALPVIEKFYKTPAQLKNMATEGHPDYAGYDKDVVDSLLADTKARKNLRGEQIDTRSEFIELYEIHGNLSQYTYKQAKGENPTEEDKDIFFQQMHVISWLKDSSDQKEYTLFTGKEKESPYLLTHLIEEDGRTLAIGAVEYLFDSQWMQNHSIKAWKDQMDITSKILFQTADENFIGQNVLTNLESGSILKHGDNKPLTQVNNGGHDISNISNFISQWKVLSQEVTSTPDAVRGTTLPSGTPYSLGAYLGTQGLSLFELMTENKGLAVEEMMRKFVIPFLKKKLNNQDEVVAMLEERDLKKIDEMYIPNQAIRNVNRKILDTILEKGQVPDINMEEAIAGEEQSIRKGLSSLGNQRILSPEDVKWSEVLKDLEWNLDIAVTNEQSDKQAILTSLTTVLQTIATNPMVLQDPNARLLFTKILSQTGVVSPIEMSLTSAQPVPMQPAQPQAAPPVPQA